jgi:pyruvate kinase
MPVPLPQIKADLEELNELMFPAEKRYRSILEKVHPSQYISALNLLHYLSFRSLDIKELQHTLHKQGYSSLANAEGYIHSQLLAVLKHFGVHGETNCTFESSRMILEGRSSRLYGNAPGSIIPSIMVTLKTSHARDLLVIKKLLRAGMNIARINCAHDKEEIWHEMVLNIHKAIEVTGIPCKIYMDLAGPKIRTKIKGSKKGKVLIEEGDTFYLTDNENFKSKLPVVHCSIPKITEQLKEGEKVFFEL